MLSSSSSHIVTIRFLLFVRNQLPDRERAICMKLLLRLTLKEDVFGEAERDQAQVVEGGED